MSTQAIGAAGTRRWWALGAVTLGVFAAGLDATVLSVALPTLATKLHAPESDLQWFSSGYLLVVAAAMLPAGLLGDRIGRRKVMLGGLSVFGLASAACAIARNPVEFLLARLALGLGSAAVIVMAVSALAVLFTDKERPRAVGIWAAANFVALPVGPILGGYLLTNAWWGWVFLINVPVALVALLAVVTLVPESHAPASPGLDPAGVLLSASGLAGLTYGLIQAGEYGWSSVSALVPMLAGLALLPGFYAWEKTFKRRGGLPLLDVGLFRSPSFSGGIALLTIAAVIMTGAIFTLPQYFQGVTGTDPMGSGIRLLPLIGGLVAGAGGADRLTARLGPKLVIALGFVVMGAGFLLGAATSLTTPTTFTTAWTVVLGLGTGLVFAPATSTALSQVRTEDAGVESAVLQALEKVGGPLGAAVFGSVVSSVYQARLPLAGLPGTAASMMKAGLTQGLAVAHNLGSVTVTHQVQDAFVHGMDAALLVSAAIATLGLVVTILLIPRRAVQEPAATTPLPEARITVRGGYHPDQLRLRAGQPVRLLFDRQESGACTARVVFPDLGISADLPDFAQTTLHLPPLAPGAYGFTCGMNRVHGTLLVEE